MKATIYTVNDMGMAINKTEVRGLEMETKPFAQYPEALWITFIPKGKRKARRIVRRPQQYTLVLLGHGHPDPGDMYGPPSTPDENGTTTRHSRYMSFDKRWVTDFQAIIMPYILETKPQILALFVNGKGVAKNI